MRGAEINDAKIILATEATTMAHGEAAAEAAAETARRTFGEGSAGDDLPSIEVASADLARGIPAIDLLHRAGLAASKSEARRLIKGGGARVNGEAIADDAAVLTSADVTARGLHQAQRRQEEARPRPSALTRRRLAFPFPVDS